MSFFANKVDDTYQWFNMQFEIHLPRYIIHFHAIQNFLFQVHWFSKYNCCQQHGFHDSLPVIDFMYTVITKGYIGPRCCTNIQVQAPINYGIIIGSGKAISCQSLFTLTEVITTCWHIHFHLYIIWNFDFGLYTSN